MIAVHKGAHLQFRSIKLDSRLQSLRLNKKRVANEARRFTGTCYKSGNYQLAWIPEPKYSVTGRNLA